MGAGYEAGYAALAGYGAPNNAAYLISGSTDVPALTAEILIGALTATLTFADSTQTHFSIDPSADSIGFGAAAPSTNTRLLIDYPTLTPTAGENGIYFDIDPALTEASSGTHTIMAGVNIRALTLTDAGGATTTAATVRIVNAPSGATNNYALWVDAGLSVFDGQVFLSDGSASAPAITFTADTDAGWYRAAANTWAYVAAAQVEAIRISSSTVVINNGNTSAMNSFRVAGDINDNLIGSNSDFNTLGLGSAGATATSPRLTIDYPTSTIVNTSSGTAISITARLTEGTSGTHTNMIGVQFEALVLTDGLASTTNAATVRIADAPSGATNNYALWIDAGVSRFDAAIDLSNISAGTSNFTITATNDTPSVTWGAAAGSEVSTGPAGYIEISVSGAARYVPFWA